MSDVEESLPENFAMALLLLTAVLVTTAMEGEEQGNFEHNITPHGKPDDDPFTTRDY